MTEKGEYNSAKGGCQSIGCLIAACHADTVSEQKAAGKKPKKRGENGNGLFDRSVICHILTLRVNMKVKSRSLVRSARRKL